MHHKKVGRPKLNLPIEEIVSLYRSGLSTREIGRRYGSDHTTIGRRLKATGGLKMRPRDRPRHVLPIGRLVSLYKQGLSTREIGRQYDEAHSTIQRCLKDAGVKMRSKGPRKLDFPISEIICLRKSGWSLRRIGRFFGGSSHTTICRRLKGGGV